MILYKHLDASIKEKLSKKFEKDPVIKKIDKILSRELEFKDKDFDEILPPYYMFFSAVQWTSFEVANIISNWLQEYEGKKFIDIGCGVGKICIYLRLHTLLKINGIEKRKCLVNIANKILKVNNVLNVKILHMNVLDLRWRNYDIFYLFNPFYEQVSEVDILQIDQEIIYSKKKFKKYVSFVYESLDKLPSGKILITYHGFGKAPPPDWKLLKKQLIGSGLLEMWEKE